MTEVNNGEGATTETPPSVMPVPQAALRTLSEQINEAGGEWEEPSEYAGSIARTMFDSSSSDDGSVTTLMGPDKIEVLPRQALVRIKSSDGRDYLGVVVAGPFYEPDGLRADAPILVAVTVRGLLLPKYHGRAHVALLAEELAGDPPTYVPPRRRPRPNSPVFVLDAAETAAVLRTHGDIRLGILEGNDDIEVGVASDKKSVLPRHLGILGTTGGGKSTTLSGFVAQAQAAGIATILLDTEGEYTAINEPTDDPNMLRSLRVRGQQAKGVPGTVVYYLAGRETANPDHPARRQFSLRFSELSPYAIAEILELNEAQQDRFIKAYDATKIALSRFKVFPRDDAEREKLMDLDELESGYPRMTLGHLYDMVRVFEAIVAKAPQDPFLASPDFNNRIDELKQIAQGFSTSSAPSWRALMGKVGRVKRFNIFDTRAASPLDYKELLRPGHVSIIDLSDTDFPQINNLVIAQILRGVQRQQDENYKAATARNEAPNRSIVVIEEAHEFLSAERIRQMPVLFQQVARISRRGRKRWLGLVFVTQLPQHLPDEVLGLINNWVLHKISDSNVINRLKRSIGGIDESLWRNLPGLAPGQAVISFTSHARPLMIAVDPTPCRLLMVE